MGSLGSGILRPGKLWTQRNQRDDQRRGHDQGRRISRAAQGPLTAPLGERDSCGSISANLKDHKTPTVPIV
jgi:hypothetical protein